MKIGVKKMNEQGILKLFLLKFHFVVFKIKSSRPRTDELLKLEKLV